MSSLSGSTIQSRYKSLLKIGGSANDEISASLQVIEDGDGNRAAFSISDNKILIKSNTTDQTDTLNVENTLGTSVLKVDTINSRVGINATPTGSLDVDNILLDSNLITTSTGALTIAGAAGVAMSNLTLTGTNTAVGLTITSSDIDSTPIGQSTPAAGTFSSLNVNNAYSLPSTAGTNAYVLTTDGAGGSSWAASAGGGGGSSLTIEETDGGPSVTDVVKIVVTNDSLTNDGSGIVTLDTSAGAHTHDLSQITDSGGAAPLNVGTITGTVAAGDHTHAAFYFHPLTDPDHPTPLEPENDAYHWVKDTPFFSNMQEQYHLMMSTQCTSGTPLTNEWHGDLASVAGGQPTTGSGAGNQTTANCRYNEITGLGTFLYKHGEPPFLQGSVGNGTNYPVTVPTAEEYLERALWSTDFCIRGMDASNGQFPQDNAMGDAAGGSGGRVMWVVSAHQILNISSAIGFLGSNHPLMDTDVTIHYTEMGFTDPQPRWKHYWDALDACLSYWEGKPSFHFEQNTHTGVTMGRANQTWTMIKAGFLAHKYLGNNKISGIKDGTGGALVGDSRDYDGLANRFYAFANMLAAGLSTPYLTSNGAVKTYGYSSWSGYMDENASRAYHTNHIRDLAHTAIISRNHHVMKILTQVTNHAASSPLLAPFDESSYGEAIVGNIRRDGTLEIAADLFGTEGMKAIAASQQAASFPYHAVNSHPNWTIMPWSDVYGVDWRTHQDSGGSSSEWPQRGVCAPFIDASSNWKNRGNFRPMMNSGSGGSSAHRLVVEKARMVPIFETLTNEDTSAAWSYNKLCLYYYLVDQPTVADNAEFEVWIDNVKVTHWRVGYYKYGGHSTSYDKDITDGKLSCNATDAVYSSLPSGVEDMIQGTPAEKGVYMVRAYPQFEDAGLSSLMDIGWHRIEIRPLDNGTLAISGWDNLLLDNSVSAYDMDFLFGCSGERYHGSTYCQGVREGVNFYNQLELTKYIAGVPQISFGDYDTRRSIEQFKYNWCYTSHSEAQLNDHTHADYITSNRDTLEYSGDTGLPYGSDFDGAMGGGTGSTGADTEVLCISGYNWRLKNVAGSASTIEVTPRSKIGASGTTGGYFASFTATNSVDTAVNIRIGDCQVGRQYKYQTDDTGAWTTVEAWHNLGGILEFEPTVGDNTAFAIKVMEI